MSDRVTIGASSTELSAPIPYWARLHLLSDTTFGRGDGVASLVDDEVQHDEWGLPYLGGKTLKGLLCAECAEILFSLAQADPNNLLRWERAAQFLFGAPGSTVADAARMAVGDACLPADLRIAIARQFEEADREATRSRMRAANLESLTTIRWQTAMDSISGAPKRNTLRSMRVVLRKTVFDAPLTFVAPPDDHARWLLAACCKALRRAGTGRNRGRGRLCVELYDRSPVDFSTDQHPTPMTDIWLAEFEQAVSA